MKNVASNYKSLLICVVEITIGLLLFANPEGFTSTVIKGVGLILLIIGAINGYRYYTDEKNGIVSGVNKGVMIVELVAGLILFFGTRMILGVLSAVSLFYGVFMLLTGISKAGWAMDLKKINMPWKVMFTNSALAIVAAVIIILNPFKTTMLLWRFIGVALLVEAAIDVVGMVQTKRA